MARELTVCDRPHPEARRELDLGRGRDADERRDGGVRPALAEERALELCVGAVEGVVVPVEAAAGLRGGDEQPEQHRPEEGLLLGRPRAGVCPREDPRGRLARKLLECDHCIVAAAEPRRALLHERAHERPVLVQRRTVALVVLDERDGQVGALVELAEEVRERAEHEAAQGVLELRSANGHAFGYAPVARMPDCVGTLPA